MTKCYRTPNLVGGSSSIVFYSNGGKTLHYLSFCFLTVLKKGMTGVTNYKRKAKQKNVRRRPERKKVRRGKLRIYPESKHPLPIPPSLPTYPPALPPLLLLLLLLLMSVKSA